MKKFVMFCLVFLSVESFVQSMEFRRRNTGRYPRDVGFMSHGSIGSFPQRNFGIAPFSQITGDVPIVGSSFAYNTNFSVKGACDDVIGSTEDESQLEGWKQAISSAFNIGVNVFQKGLFDGGFDIDGSVEEDDGDEEGGVEEIRPVVSQSPINGREFDEAFSLYMDSAVTESSALQEACFEEKEDESGDEQDCLPQSLVVYNQTASESPVQSDEQLYDEEQRVLKVAMLAALMAQQVGCDDDSLRVEYGDDIDEERSVVSVEGNHFEYDVMQTGSSSKGIGKICIFDSKEGLADLEEKGVGESQKGISVLSYKITDGLNEDEDWALVVPTCIDGLNH